MTTTIYHYPNCSTCNKALKWLAGRGVEVTPVDIVKSPPTADELRAMWQLSGQELKKLFNTAGQSYRNGRFKDRIKAMSEEEQLAALAADGKLIKRPLLQTATTTLVGFKEPAYEALFGTP